MGKATNIVLSSLVLTLKLSQMKCVRRTCLGVGISFVVAVTIVIYKSGTHFLQSFRDLCY